MSVMASKRAAPFSSEAPLVKKGCHQEATASTNKHRLSMLNGAKTFQKTEVVTVIYILCACVVCTFYKMSQDEYFSLGRSIVHVYGVVYISTILIMYRETP